MNACARACAPKKTLPWRHQGCDGDERRQGGRCTSDESSARRRDGAHLKIVLDVIKDTAGFEGALSKNMIVFICCSTRRICMNVSWRTASNNSFLSSPPPPTALQQYGCWLRCRILLAVAKIPTPLASHPWTQQIYSTYRWFTAFSETATSALTGRRRERHQNEPTHNAAALFDAETKGHCQLANGYAATHRHVCWAFVYSLTKSCDLQTQTRGHRNTNTFIREWCVANLYFQKGNNRGRIAHLHSVQLYNFTVYMYNGVANRKLFN